MILGGKAYGSLTTRDPGEDWKAEERVAMVDVTTHPSTCGCRLLRTPPSMDDDSTPPVFAMVGLSWAKVAGSNTST